MQLHDDAWDSILLRKADEAPGGIAPLNYVWTAPGYDPSQFTTPSESLPTPAATPQQVVITAKKIPPVPAPIQIPILQFKPVAMPTVNPWDQITARRPVMAPTQSSWMRYLPWLAAAAAAALLLATMSGKKSKPATARSRRPSARRVSYARRRR